jgi:hypothetical protein
MEEDDEGLWVVNVMFYQWRKPWYLKKISDLLHATDKLYHKELHWAHLTKGENQTNHSIV